MFSDATGYAVSPAVARRAHGLALVLALGLTIAWWRSAGRSRPDSLLLVLAAILVVRCLLDPGDHSYYHAAAALALLGYEALRPRARFPWLAGGFLLALWVITRVNEHLRTDAAFSIVYLSCVVPLVVGIAFIAYRRTPRVISTT